MVLRRIVPQALLNNNRVVLEGEGRERLPERRVYISPSTGRIYDSDKGDTIGNLPPDAVEVDKTTWWFKLWRREKESCPSFDQRSNSNVEQAQEFKDEGKWYDRQEGIMRLKADLAEMKRFFPNFELFKDDNEQILWAGKIDGIGEITIEYPSDYAKELFKVTAQGLTETQNTAIRQKIVEYQGLNITPTDALIVTMRYLLAEKAKQNAVVPDIGRQRETETRNAADEQIRT